MKILVGCDLFLLFLVALIGSRKPRISSSSRRRSVIGLDEGLLGSLYLLPADRTLSGRFDDLVGTCGARRKMSARYESYRNCVFEANQALIQLILVILLLFEQRV